jgi:hypothetical protein
MLVPIHCVAMDVKQEVNVRDKVFEEKKEEKKNVHKYDFLQGNDPNDFC